MLFPPPRIRKRAPYGRFRPILGLSLVKFRLETPTVQLKGFAPFFWVGGGRVCVWYMSWGFWAAGWPIEKVP